MAKMTYSEQLRHPNWQRKRLEALEAAHWTCSNCGDGETTLNVHHKRYVKGRMAWEYETDQLMVMCEPCHQAHHENQDLLNRLLADYPEMVLPTSAVIAGYLSASINADPGTCEEVRQLDPMYYELGLAMACLESLERDGWRAFVRDYAKSRNATPPVKSIIDMWDEEPDGET